MRILIYGGTFDPPHNGHVHAFRAAAEQLRPDELLLIPAGIPPHKALSGGTAGPCARLALTRLASEAVPGAEVSDIELSREGKSYTFETLRTLQSQYPGAQFTMLIGTDMLLTFEQWREFEWLLQNMELAVLSRYAEDDKEVHAQIEHLQKRYGARITRVAAPAKPLSSSEVRAALCQRRGAAMLPEKVYARIIQERLYGAKPELAWLREKAYAMLKPKRVPHVRGCEEAAVLLARRWGVDEGDAAEAAILHDVTKKLSFSEQLELCKKYAIVNDDLENGNEKLLHAKTGAALCRDIFGVPEHIYEAIRWHTTGKPDMTMLEKIVYMADYMEPTRDFPGVEALRKLAFEDLDEAMILGLSMSVEEVRGYGRIPHENTVGALEQLLQLKEKRN